ncbi:hypothetical protein [Pseudonocardia oceani]|uniref:hypothetical protein n=1 Tax=Pseudonocardia oceani TaxID=2792013 RepID=UPI00226B005F|nr:hypothetical protein [Pseudonocardia oceani]
MTDAAVGASAHREIAVTPWYAGTCGKVRSRLSRKSISARICRRTTGTPRRAGTSDGGTSGAANTSGAVARTLEAAGV